MLCSAEERYCVCFPDNSGTNVAKANAKEEAAAAEKAAAAEAAKEEAARAKAETETNASSTSSGSYQPTPVVAADASLRLVSPTAASSASITAAPAGMTAEAAAAVVAALPASDRAALEAMSPEEREAVIALGNMSQRLLWAADAALAPTTPAHKAAALAANAPSAIVTMDDPVTQKMLEVDTPKRSLTPCTVNQQPHNMGALSHATIMSAVERSVGADTRR